MVTQSLDGVSFRLNRPLELSWLAPYGAVFRAFDETGSGCLGLGVRGPDGPRFLKIAGADTVEAELPPAESVETLKNAVRIYGELRHPRLPRLLSHRAHGALYLAEFEWARGECLFDHWNFGLYAENPALKSPGERFRALPAAKKLAAAEVVFSFLGAAAEAGYAAVDFYDGSLLYDFGADVLTVCDIDLFRKRPVVNDVGAAWPGTKRLKAPEEYVRGAPIGEDTNVFTLGALLFDWFGSFSREDVARRYRESRFFPCPPERWQLGAASYAAARRAVEPDRTARFPTVAAFHAAWNAALLNRF